MCYDLFILLWWSVIHRPLSLPTGPFACSVWENVNSSDFPFDLVIEL